MAGYAQTKVYASNAVTTTPTHVASLSNSYDQNISTSAELSAYSGVAILGGAYTSDIELQFSSELPAYTTSLVKISADDPILGGLLGGALSSLLGTLLTGNQIFTVDVKNSLGNVVLTGDSSVANSFATAKLRVVINDAGDYFLRITPDQNYKSIKITNKLSVAIALGITKKLNVFEAYYISGSALCGEATYTSTSATSIVNIGDAGVTDPKNVLTASTTDFSVLSIGLLGVGPSIEQIVYFEGPSNASDTFGVRLSTSASLLSAGIASNVSVVASYQGAVVQTKTLAELITLNALTMTGGAITTLYMSPGSAVDRITVRLSSFAGVAQSLNFYGVTKTLSVPGINAYTAICSGSTVSLTATVTTGTQIRWYTVASGGTAVATTNSGVAFVTPVLTSNTTYYAEQFNGSCTGIRLAVPVTVVAKPIAGVIAGEQTICLNKQPASLSSVSADAGGTITYRWESSLDDVSWAVISGETGVTYQPPVLLKNTFYRRITINTQSGIICESTPTSSVKVTTKNCMVYANPMVRQRIKSGT
ncbi:immunoglobulin domain-containing protein [Flavobacterium suzhouense]|uniref:Ig-like domain-containing protein n=1 Tax=Flavobacterium suzhouense TaxID=1529638 RepID=A0ABW5NVL7_9FLAO